MTAKEKALELMERVQVEQLSYITYNKETARKGAKLIIQEVCTVVAFLNDDAYRYWCDVYVAVDDV